VTSAAGPSHVSHLIVGAGITGLAAAAFLGRDRDYLIVEGDQAIGGYCKTVTRDGFTWDYSGHFFHFKHPEIEAWLRQRMPGQEVRTVHKRSFISYAGRMIDFPFQKNIHQLPRPDFIECLHDLYFARSGEGPPPAEHNFKEMLYARYGRGIAEKFLIPYNEKLYACDLSTLDRDAMGRFFPHADLSAIIRNMRAPDNASYNATFTYPRGGAIQYVNALASEVPPERIAVGEALLEIDLARKTARTTKRRLHFDHLISSAPFPALARMTGLDHDRRAFTWNKVLVLNLGFDRKGARDVHWVYYPDRARTFYRIGYYDNIFQSDRLSLYVELGYPSDATIDVDGARARVLAELRDEGVITDHQLVAHHAVVMNPAYVHITRGSLEEVARLRRVLAEGGVHSIGRYGAWTYCSIEDNIFEARQLVGALTSA
jgi:protoporphyrinogen oxidase